MGHNEVDPPPAPDRWQHSEDIEPHLPLGILVGATIVPMAAIKSQDLNASELHHFRVNTTGT